MLETLLLIGSISFLGAMSPGPDFVVITKNTLVYGRKHGIYTSLGVALAILTHCLIVVIGLGAIISTSVIIYQIIKIGGALYLMYLGIVLRREKSDSSAYITKQNVDIQKRSALRSIKNGYITNIANPKFIVFLLSLFAQFFTGETSRIMYALASLTIMSTSLLRFCSISVLLGGQTIQQFFRKYLTYIQKFLGSILLALGIKIITTD